MKKKTVLIAVALLLVALMMSVTLTGCLRFGMSQSKILVRMEKQGYVNPQYLVNVSAVLGKDATYYTFTDVMKFEKVIEVEEELEVSWVYVFFCSDEKTANWTKETVDELRAEGLEYGIATTTYQNRLTVMWGLHDALTAARGY